MTVNQQSILDASKLAFVDDVKAALEAIDDADTYTEFRTCDSQGHTSLHLLAANPRGESCIELYLEKAGDDAPNLIALQDSEGNTPLHLCAHFPMACYQLAAEAPSVCLVKNKAGITPIDLARQHGSGEALNALLLACSGNSSPDVIDSMNDLTKKGAVADTWAPNGQSSLMLAAAANSADAITLLLSAGASLELQDAMGRTALMWAAGSGAVDALKVLLDAGASVALRDRRNRTATDYAETPEAKKVLETRVKELESKAAAAQEALLAELLEEEERKAATKATKKAKKKAKANEKKGKNTTKSCGEESTIATGTATSDNTNEVSGTDEGVSVGAGEEPITAAELQLKKEKAPISETNRAETIMPSTSTPLTLQSQPDFTAEATDTQQATPDVPSSPPPSAAIHAPSPTPARPPSPDWCTVGAPKKEKHQQQQQVPTTMKPTSSVTITHQYPNQHQIHSNTHSHHAHHPPHHHHLRSPSVGSVTSVGSMTSGTSHETDTSKHSGSERSVLRRVAAVGAAVGNNNNNSSCSAQQFAGPRLPAPLQRQAVCTRSSSGGEEIGAAALFGQMMNTNNASSTTPAGSTGGASVKKPGSTWASVAASQKGGNVGSTGGNNSTTAAGIVAAATVAAAGASQVPEQQPQQQQLAHATLASAVPRGAWPSITTGTNTLTTPSGGSSIDGGSHSNFNLNQSMSNETSTTMTSNTAAADGAAAAAAAEALAAFQQAAFQQAASEEIAALRAEIQRLKLKNAAAELAHHQELVAILQDASQHENAAVAKATSEERLACTVRFASMLQNNGVALAGAIPGLLAGAGITTTSDLELFMNNSSSSSVGAAAAPSPSSNTNGGQSAGRNININLASPSEHMAQMYSTHTTKSTSNSTLSAAITGSLNNAVAIGNNISSSGGVGADVSPLSTSPFSYEVGEHLRGDFFGNHSAFMVPAVETHALTAAAASPPQAGSSSTSAAAAAAAGVSAWSPLGHDTSSGWGTAIR